MRYYQNEIECASREYLRDIQGERLKKTVRHMYENVSYYRELMHAKKITPEDIKSVDDLYKLPFLTKEDLRKTYPFGLLAVPRKDVVRLQSTSGTTGKRVMAYYTKNDLDIWSDCCARALTAAGVGDTDTVQVSYGYGLFTGGAGIHAGSEKIGALTVPMSSGNTERQIQFMCDVGSTVLCCTPSYAEYLAECIIDKGLEDNINLKVGIFGAEAWSEEMRRSIETRLKIKAYDIYGLTEICGPGVSFECEMQNGMHVNEDYFIPEIINPQTGEPMQDGEKGELVFSCISKEAFPLLRYRTRDICVLNREKCACGRTLLRMAKPMGRSDDMLIIRGVNVFPSQIESVLINCGFPANYQIVIDRENYTDTFDVRVEVTADMFSDTVRQVSQRERELVAAMKTMLGISPRVTLVAPHSIERSEGKAIRVIDKRKI